MSTPKHFTSGTDLDRALEFVMDSPGEFHHKQRFHTVFLRTKFYLPCLVENPHPEEKFYPLRLFEGEKTFFITFDSESRYLQWLSISNGNSDQVFSVQIFGHELIDCLGNYVYLGLNPGQENYYEMTPGHIQFLKKAIDKTKNPQENQ